VAKSEDLIDLNGINELVNNLVDVLASSLAGGETFLPGTTDYDDLFYKLVQGSSTLEQFSQTCISPCRTPTAIFSAAYKCAWPDFAKRPSQGMQTLLTVCKHYQSLLQDHQSKSKSRHLSSEEVTRIIKQGYDTIQLSGATTPTTPTPHVGIDGVGAPAGGKYKEGEFRGILKKIWRICIADGTVLLDRADGN
jgi:Domain of unknown function (DUF1741)